MTKQRSLKRAMLLSALSMLLCVSMLVGSTYAWFTDSVTSGNNKIVSGNLDVELWHCPNNQAQWGFGYDETKGVQIEGDTPLFLNVEGKPILWEPGASAGETFRVKNAGSLAMKFLLNLKTVSKTTTPTGKDLTDILNVQIIELVNDANGVPGHYPDDVNYEGLFGDGYVIEGELLPGETADFNVAIDWFPTANDNEYNVAGGLEVVFAIDLLATQLTYEEDSYDDQYDKDAAYGTYIELDAGADLLAAMASAESGKPLTIKLNGDVEWPTDGHHNENDITPASSIVIDGNGYTITATGAGVTPLGDTEAPMTLRNVNIVDNSVSYDEAAWELSYLELGGNVLNCVDVDFADPIIVGSGDATFTNCTFVGHYDKNSTTTTQYGVWVENGNSTFTNCIFSGTRGLKICDKYAAEVGTVVVDGCTFDNISEKPGIAIDDADTQDMKITIKNSTFINCQAGDQGLYIYETDNTVPTLSNNNVYSNAKYVGTAAELAAMGGTNVEGVIILTDDIDLNGAELKTIGVTYNKNLEIVGNGHAISNAKIVTGRQNGMTNVGMFYVETGATFTVSNLTVNGMTVEEGVDDNTIGAAFISYANSGSVVTLNNVDVNGASINNTKGNAAIYVGYTVSEVNMNGCDIGADCTVNGERADKTGAFVGTANTASCVVTVTDCTNGTAVTDYGRVINGATYN